MFVLSPSSSSYSSTGVGLKFVISKNFRGRISLVDQCFIKYIEVLNLLLYSTKDNT